MSTATRPSEGMTLLGHPISLFVLFFTEFWERFSFYGMRALLVLYMTDEVAGLSYSDDRGYSVYGAYGAMVYATPVIGGFLADRLLGYRQAILLGGLLMAAGHFAMAIESELFFYGALGLLILGNGFFKPNISSLVGQLYPDGDPRRDGAFTIFYMGINAGAWAAPLACAYLVSAMGDKNAAGEVIRDAWHWGFGLAGVGMLLGLATFLAFQHQLGDRGLPPKLERSGGPSQGALQAAVWVAPLLVLPPCMWLVTQDELLGGALIGLGALTFGGLFVSALRSDKVERERMFVVLVLMFFSMLFWAFFEQAGSSINLFTERNVDRTMLGDVVPAASFQSVNPGFILLFAPLFAMAWTRLSRIGRDPSAPTKFALGILQLGLGFAVLWYGASLADDNGMTWVGWLILGYLLHTTGELCLSPVGLSMVTKMSPARMVGLVMGAWFLATSFSHYLGSMIAKLTSAGGHGEEGGEPNPVETVQAYGEVFGSIGVVAVIAAVVLFALSPVLTRWMHLDENGEAGKAAA